jgi:hypothetical protein
VCVPTVLLQTFLHIHLLWSVTLSLWDMPSQNLATEWIVTLSTRLSILSWIALWTLPRLACVLDELILWKVVRHCSSFLRGLWCGPHLFSSLSRSHWEGAILPWISSIWPRTSLGSGWHRVIHMLGYVYSLPSRCCRSSMGSILDRMLRVLIPYSSSGSSSGYVKLSVLGQSFECSTACAPIECIKCLLCPGFFFFGEGC